MTKIPIEIIKIISAHANKCAQDIKASHKEFVEQIMPFCAEHNWDLETSIQITSMPLYAYLETCITKLQNLVNDDAFSALDMFIIGLKSFIVTQKSRNDEEFKSNE